MLVHCCKSVAFKSPYSDGAVHVFVPSFIIAAGPEVNALLLGSGSSSVTLSLETVTPTNGSLPHSDCVQSNLTGQWELTSSYNDEAFVLNIQLKLNRLLTFCGNLTHQTNCCPERLCVLETLRVTACQDLTVVATLLVQAEIYANITSDPVPTDNEMKLQVLRQEYHPLGFCPCDLQAEACDVRCCCDQDCTADVKRLFSRHCYKGAFGGNVTPAFDQLCSARRDGEGGGVSPDWFPFLCVDSSSDNSPFLGLFYHGHTRSWFSPGFSFGRSDPAAAPRPTSYSQDVPILTHQGEKLLVPQRSLNGQCLWDAPVAYLRDFDVHCVSTLRAEACPVGPAIGQPLSNGQEGAVWPVVTYQTATDMSHFLVVRSPVMGFSPTAESLFADGGNLSVPAEEAAALELEPEPGDRKCENVTLGVDYVFFWSGATISKVTVLVTTANLSFALPATVTQRFSGRFVNSASGLVPGEMLSGNPGYQAGRAVLAGNAKTNGTRVDKASIRTWKPAGNGLCASALTSPILFGQDSISGCVLRLNLGTFSNCSILWNLVFENLLSLTPATHIARRGNSNYSDLSEWVELFRVLPLQTAEKGGLNKTYTGFCTNIPAILNIRFITAVTGAVQGVPQWEILGAEVSFSVETWYLNCGGGNAARCDMNSLFVQSFAVGTSVQFIQVPAQPKPPLSRFQMNYTEYDCKRNDVCWPELAYPLLRRDTGEWYAESLAQGLLLVFLTIVAAVLGSPWSKLRQVWHNLS
ncbi:tectonic-2 isoform X2 [Callorhinchus milii]|uniref:tectonic-2 isoform X2 n=1 Tax=Callorhinchus milii TaxID=7868 RepID=UPI001C3FE467|nr:tectonic-2 isoform X2 [Callorhinchus milii]